MGRSFLFAIIIAGIGAITSCRSSGSLNASTQPAEIEADSTPAPAQLAEIPTAQVLVQNTHPGIQVAQYQIAHSMVYTGDGYFLRGVQVFQGRYSVSSSLRMKGIHAPRGVQVVQVVAYPGIVNAIMRDGDADASPFLSDRDGNRFNVFGYILEAGQQTELFLDPDRGVTVSDIPSPASESDRLLLLFHVPEGTALRSFGLDDRVRATLNVEVSR